MTNVDKLAERHIREHEARLSHLEDLMERARQEAEKTGSAESVQEELNEIDKERDKMADYVENLKTKSPKEFMETAGPMVMWELVAGRLEKLIERIKKK
ncbi:MAG: hypothetical protein PVF34_10650 [Gammaproteobacteria bacterium]|jgi:hypothetical protein